MGPKLARPLECVQEKGTRQLLLWEATTWSLPLGESWQILLAPSALILGSSVLTVCLQKMCLENPERLEGELGSAPLRSGFEEWHSVPHFVPLDLDSNKSRLTDHQGRPVYLRGTGAEQRLVADVQASPSGVHPWVASTCFHPTLPTLISCLCADSES